MKRKIAATSALLILVGMASAQDLATYKATYDKELEATVLGKGLQIIDLGQQYAKGLEALLGRVKQAGDLDKTTAVMDEISRFGKDRAMPSTPSTMLDIQLLQAAYTKRAAFYETDMAKKIISLSSTYDSVLERLQKSLVTSDKLGDAKAVQAERQHLQNSEALVSAKSRLAAHTAAASVEPPIIGSAAKAKHPADAKRFGMHYYKLVLGDFTWDAAKRRCEDMEGEGYLVCIGSEKENAFVNNLANGNRIWLGATDERTEGRWLWITGEKFEYANWGRGEPTNSHGKEHYLNMQEDGSWFDVTRSNGTIKGFVCEWDQ